MQHDQQPSCCASRRPGRCFPSMAGSMAPRTGAARSSSYRRRARRRLLPPPPRPTPSSSAWLSSRWCSLLHQICEPGARSRCAKAFVSSFPAAYCSTVALPPCRRPCHGPKRGKSPTSLATARDSTQAHLWRVYGAGRVHLGGGRPTTLRRDGRTVGDRGKGGATWSGSAE